MKSLAIGSGFMRIVIQAAYCGALYIPTYSTSAYHVRALLYMPVHTKYAINGTGGKFHVVKISQRYEVTIGQGLDEVARG